MSSPEARTIILSYAPSMAFDADARVMVVRHEALAARNGVVEDLTQTETAGLGVRGNSPLSPASLTCARSGSG